MRRQFFAALLLGLRIVWPVLSGLLLLIIALGLVAGLLEGWSVPESLYFSLVTGLTIGYGDLAPRTPGGRALAILIGATGILLAGLIVAVAVKALTDVREGGKG